MAESLEVYNQKEKDFTEKISEQNWIQTRVADIATMYQRIVDVEVLADRFITINAWIKSDGADICH